MLFHSIQFAVFLVIVFTTYWLIGNKKTNWQNILLLAASYFFYACWDWRFLFLLLFSTFLDYFTGYRMSVTKSQKNKKGWLLVSIFINLGLLGLFKYYNFFIESFSTILNSIGLTAEPDHLNLILPLGISFYTFHGLSYVLDIYHDKIKPELNILDYSLFVSFFPLLIAGPIERATHLLPQVKQPRVFNYEKAINGLRQILWGLFKKVVIADNCAKFADVIYDHSTAYSGSVLFIGAFLFAIQVYCDFSGYSDIAIGTARLFGFELLRNFAFPFFSRDIAEFWRRWHISLTSGFRDYLYIPLGGSKISAMITIRNTIIVFLISGLWHGANWTYIAMGAYFALLFLPLINKGRKQNKIVAEGRLLPNLKELWQMLSTFLLVIFGLIIFRSSHIGQAFEIIQEVISPTLFSRPNYPEWGKAMPIFILILFFFTIEWIGREREFALEDLELKWGRFYRHLFYYAILFLIFWFSGKEQQFIYFQF